MSNENNSQITFKLTPFFFRFACITGLFATASYLGQMDPLKTLGENHGKGHLDAAFPSTENITFLSMFSDTISAEVYPDNWNNDFKPDKNRFFSDDTSTNLRQEPIKP